METTKKVWKIFGEWAYEEEQAWLNEMADQGWALKKVSCLGMKFEFEACEPGMYTVAALKAEKDDPRIAELIADGAELIADGAELLTVNEGWHYFRKKKADGELVLFRDIDSQIAHLDKLMKEMIGAEILTIIMMLTQNSFIGAVILTGLLLYFLGRMKAKKDELLREKAAAAAKDKQ